MPVSRGRPKGRAVVARDRRRSRERDRSLADATDWGEHSDCDCPGLGHLVGELRCGDCGQSVEFEAWFPTHGVVGEFRQAGRTCSYCGGDAEGVARIVELERL